jgi:hypothetical protein
VAHGTPFKGDSLLDCYGNKPFGRLHTALRELHALFQPMFSAVSDPLKDSKNYTPRVQEVRFCAAAYFLLFSC